MAGNESHEPDTWLNGPLPQRPLFQRPLSQSPSSQSTLGDPIDLRLSEALHDVGLPAGFRQRMLCRIEAHESDGMQDAATMVALPGAATERLPVSVISRRAWLAAGGTAVAAGLGGAVWWFRGSSLSLTQFEGLCLNRIEDILENPPSWSPVKNQDDIASVFPLLDHVIRPLNVEGSAEFAAAPVASSGRVWKFRWRGSRFYVFEFKQARSIRGLTSQAEVFRRVSGGWSLAGMQTPEDLFVMAAEGNIDELLNPPVYA